MQRWTCLTWMLLSLGAAQTCLAQHGDAGAKIALPAVSAAPEARQFDFLIGQWEIELTPKVSGLAAMIHGTPRVLGSWKAWRAFDGFGIDDELRTVDGSGNPVTLNHAMRIYDPKLGQWSISGLDVYRSRFNTATGHWIDGVMQIEGFGFDGSGRPYRSRTRFDQISKESFHMQQDRSFDDGETWEEAAISIEAKRVAEVAPR